MAESPAKPTRIPYLVGHACVSPLVFYITKTPLVRMRHKNSLSPYAISYLLSITCAVLYLNPRTGRASPPTMHPLPLTRAGYVLENIGCQTALSDPVAIDPHHPLTRVLGPATPADGLDGTQLIYYIP